MVLFHIFKITGSICAGASGAIARYIHHCNPSYYFLKMEHKMKGKKVSCMKLPKKKVTIHNICQKDDHWRWKFLNCMVYNQMKQHIQKYACVIQKLISHKDKWSNLDYMLILPILTKYVQWQKCAQVEWRSMEEMSIAHTHTHKKTF